MTSPRELRLRDQPGEPGVVACASSSSGSPSRSAGPAIGISTSMSVPLPDGLSILICPSERLDSIPEPGQSRPSARIGAAHAVIANRKKEHVVLDTEGDPHARGVRVLGRVGERLRDGVVGGYLDLVWEPVLEADVELDPDVRASP